MNRLKRYQLTIFFVIFLGYGMYSYNRKSVSFVIPKLLQAGLQPDQVGLIASSQNLAYAISKFFGGIASDQLSSRVLFSFGLLLSGLATVLFSYSNSVAVFTACWFLNGLAQGAGWPSIAKLLKNWFSPSELGTWWSMASASANLSGCLAPFLATYLVINYGWRFSLVFAGGLSTAAGVLSYTSLKDSPTDIGMKSFDQTAKKAQTKEESPEINNNNGQINSSADKNPEKPRPMVLLIKSPFIWVISVCYLIVSCLKTSVTDWAQLYLIEDCNQSDLVASGFVSSVELGGFFGGIAAGFLSDIYMRRSMKNNRLPDNGNPRMTVGLGLALITTIFLHLMYFNVNSGTSPLLVNIIGAFVGFAIYGQIAIFGVVATQSVISEISGTAHAIVALAANVGSIAAGLPFATIAKYYSWSTIFFVLEAMSLFTVAFMLITSNVSYKMGQPNTINVITKHSKKVN